MKCGKVHRRKYRYWGQGMKKKDKGINPDLEAAINESLKMVMQDETASITEKMKVIDRALKLESIRLKLTDDEWGSGFATDDE